jgi:amino acid adenylation domain-containing protein
MPAHPHKTLLAWFHAQAELTPAATALVMGDQSMTYLELEAQSDRLAGVLRSCGVARETVVAIYLERSPEMVVGLLGIMKAGGAYLPIDPALPAQRIDYLISDAAVSLILTQSELRGTVATFGVPLLVIDEVGSTKEIAGTEQTIVAEPRSEDLAYLIYTSGSTGNPKGTEITHGALVNLLASMVREPGLSSTDTLVAVTTLSFDIAALEIFGPLVCGAKLVLASREEAIDPESLTKLLQKSDASVMQATPSSWGMLVESGWMGKANLRIWCGGEPLAVELAESLLARGRELWNLYGPTETTIWSAVHRVRNGENPILVGRPIRNTRIYILNSDGQPVPVGVVGELYIGGDGVARAYWKRPELTDAHFLPDHLDCRSGRRMYRTGDLAKFRHDGQIQIVGRADQQIKLRGYRIEPGEIEAAIERHPDVRQAIVMVQGDGAARHLVAFVKLSQSETMTEDLRPWLRERLPEYMVPSEFFARSEIPMTPNGKVDRKQLVQETGIVHDNSLADIRPRNSVEESLAKIWREVLGRDRVSVRDNFFDLGGHSLLLIRVHARIRHELDANVAVVDLFRYPTIESMASWLDRRRSELTVTAGVSS